ncbi:MAG: 5-carboxymethyl-2-hydroxymuconate semialdehyde dehydrogenase [Sulfobacillus sp.]
MRTWQHLIGGSWVAGVQGRSFETVNPATGAHLADVAEGTAEDVDLAVGAAVRAFEQSDWATDPEARAAALRRVADGLIRRQADFVAIEVEDTGLPISQAKGQAARAASNFTFFAEMATRMTGETYPQPGRFLNYTVRRPVGVAGLITPWNTPLMLESWKVAPCLASGNTCVLKPAEWSPLSAVLLGEVITEAGVPDGVFNIVHGFGETAGAPLVVHPQVPLISFTGETSTGQSIIRAGAERLKRFSMELGGKSPVVVFSDADQERALDAVVFGVYSLNGERCTAGSRVLIEDRIYPQFIERLARRVAAIRVGDPTDARTEVGPLIHPEHLSRVQGYLAAARQEGATVLLGGERPPGLDKGNFLTPALITEVRPNMRVVQEEVFGPVLVAMPFHGEEEALALANAVRYGLAGYVWTNDLTRAHRFAQALHAGMVWVNSQNVRDLRTPFGGAKDSGIGREGGHYSFDFYTETTSVQVALGPHAIPKFGADPV